MEIRALYQSILGLRVPPDRDDILKAVMDLEAAHTTLCEEADDGSLPPQLRPRRTTAVNRGRMLIELWNAKAKAKNCDDISPEHRRERRRRSSAFLYAQELAEHVRTLTEVLTVQRRTPPSRQAGTS
ncbi:hypothetical protein ACH4SP_02940 [Streptomyces sp. NPDC021093]|uniref:hypothetical protein n=1 Tax=Streptomyces sp. NPDC021093 TaxID=3365112 RepID=UPI003789F85D